MESDNSLGRFGAKSIIFNLPGIYYNTTQKENVANCSTHLPDPNGSLEIPALMTMKIGYIQRELISLAYWQTLLQPKIS